MNKCPKCGHAEQYDKLPMYCPGAVPLRDKLGVNLGTRIPCRHLKDYEHLYNRCVCTYEHVVGPCLDAKK